MKPIRKALLLSLFLFANVLSFAGKDDTSKISDEILSSLKMGNAKILATYFNQNIELVILDNSNVYSKAQAEQVVANFFSKHQPERLTEKHKGGKEGAQYYIYTLKTKQESFRVYMLIRKTKGKDVIHQLRIEKEEE